MSLCLYYYGDILGYRRLIEARTPRTVHSILLDAIRAVEAFLFADEQERATQTASATPRDRARLSHRRYGRLEYTFAFDTLMLYQRDLGARASVQEFGYFCKAVAYLTLLLLDRHGIKMRGVIAATNECFVDPGLLTFGNIAECFETEKSMELAATCIRVREPLKYDWLGQGANTEICHYYQCPTKGGEVEHLMLNLGQDDLMRMLQRAGICLGRVLVAIRSEMREASQDPRIQSKLKNTFEYISWEIRRREISTGRFEELNAWRPKFCRLAVREAQGALEES